MSSGEDLGGSGSRECSTGPDALASVIDWLDTAKLGSIAGDGDEPGFSCGDGASAVLHLDARDFMRVAAPDPPKKPPSVMRGQCGPGAAMAVAAGGNAASHCCGDAARFAVCGASLDSPEDMRVMPYRVKAEREAEDWDRRQRQTGATGRLVEYEAGDSPQDDLILRGGCGLRVVVASVTVGGKAFCQGVKAGDLLVSIDGQKDFVGKPGREVLSRVAAPVAIVFMGFVGKLQSEVRLSSDRGEVLLSSLQPVVVGGKDTSVQMVSEVVFQPTQRRTVLTAARRDPSPFDAPRPDLPAIRTLQLGNEAGSEPDLPTLDRNILNPGDVAPSSPAHSRLLQAVAKAQPDDSLPQADYAQSRDSELFSF